MAALKRFLLLGLFVIVAGSGAACATTSNEDAFIAWRQGVAEEAVAQGVSRPVAESVMQQAMLDERVLTLDQKQPETTITFADYLRRTLTSDRVAEALRLSHENAGLLNAISERFNVPPAIIVALWGIESSFGKVSGDYKIVDSLATLAFEGRRGAFFRGELLTTLHIIDEQHLAPDLVRGSWAGAMGQCQFMPSTYLHHAVSYSGSGAPDIWNNTADVLASIAAYLASEGWQGTGWGVEVQLAAAVPDNQIGIAVKHSLADWQGMGVAAPASVPFTDVSSLSLIAPDGPTGPHYLVNENYRALMRWNRSTFFATTIGLFADRIADAH